MRDLPQGKTLRFYRANSGFIAGLATFAASTFLVRAAVASHGRTVLLILGGVFVIFDVLILIDMRRAKRLGTKRPT